MLNAARAKRAEMAKAPRSLMPYREVMFLGFMVSPSFADSLAAAPSALREALIGQDEKHYLADVRYKNERYIGKRINEGCTTAALDLSAEHIYSVLKKIVPDFPYDQHNLYLFSFATPL
jgi:hypothetical protein